MGVETIHFLHIYDNYTFASDRPVRQYHFCKKKSLWRLLDCPFARWFISHAGYELQEHRSSRKLAAQTKGRWEGVKCRRSDLFNIEDLDNIFTYEAHTTTVNPFFKDWALFPDGLGRRREFFFFLVANQLNDTASSPKSILDRLFSRRYYCFI